MNKKKVLLVTNNHFWKRNGGGQNRIFELVKYLDKIVDLTILFMANEGEKDKQIINSSGLELNIIYITNFINYQSSDEDIQGFKFDTPDIRREINNYFQNVGINICIVEYFHKIPILNFLSSNILTILDTHDLLSNYQDSYKAIANRESTNYKTHVVSLKQELKLFECFNYILLIQKEEYEIVQKIIGSKAIMVPHPIIPSKNKNVRKVDNICFIAADTAPNADAILWFLRNVWPQIIIKYPNLKLNIYGRIFYILHKFNPVTMELYPWLMEWQNEYINQDKHTLFDNVIFHGFVSDTNSIYQDNDIAINPVRFGSGLKIKNIEALGQGLPLITTSHGFNGIKDSESEICIIADSSIEFESALTSLIEDENKRVSLQNAGLSFVEKTLSPDKCFGHLEKVILN